MLRLIVSFAFLLVAVTAEAKHLFVLSGQSNMQGLRPAESFIPAVESEFGKENVIVVHDALGGQPIRRWYKNWKPAAGDQPEATGDLYDRLMTKVNAALKESGTTWDKLSSVSFLWMQGERDAREKHGNVYGASLRGLYDQFSTDAGRDDVNFVIGRLSDFDMANQRYPHWTMIREVQVQVANQHPRGAWVNTDDLNDGLNRKGKPIENDLHYSGEGYKIFGQRLADEAIKLIRRQVAANQPVLIDLNNQTQRQVVVDREPGQYLGHPTTCLLEDGKTILCVYPKGHGRGEIVYKRSTDGGLTWSDRLPTPESWATSKEVPTLHRVIDADGNKRIIMWSGLYPARLAVTEDDGKSWSELEPVGDWGGIVVMGFVQPLRTGKGHYLAMFHDDGRFFTRSGKASGTFTLYKTFSTDGGLTWSFPEPVFRSSQVHLCEPGCIRSPDGNRLAVLLRENARRKNSHVIFSDDEGKTWSQPRELPLALTGDRHTGKYGPDGRLFISFRCRSPKHAAATRPFEGDWVGWVGTWDDLVQGRSGQYSVRLKDNTKGYDTTYPGVELLPDGTFVTTTYGHWVEGEQPYILSVRFKLSELDTL